MRFFGVIANDQCKRVVVLWEEDLEEADGGPAIFFALCVVDEFGCPCSESGGMCGGILASTLFITQIESFVPSEDEKLLIINESGDDVYAGIASVKYMNDWLGEGFSDHFEHLDKDALSICEVFAPGRPPAHHAHAGYRLEGSDHNRTPVETRYADPSLGWVVVARFDASEPFAFTAGHRTQALGIPTLGLFHHTVVPQ